MFGSLLIPSSVVDAFSSAITTFAVNRRSSIHTSCGVDGPFAGIAFAVAVVFFVDNHISAVTVVIAVHRPVAFHPLYICCRSSILVSLPPR